MYCIQLEKDSIIKILMKWRIFMKKFIFPLLLACCFSISGVGHCQSKIDDWHKTEHAYIESSGKNVEMPVFWIMDEQFPEMKVFAIMYRFSLN